MIELEAVIRAVAVERYGFSAQRLRVLTGGLDRAAWTYALESPEGERLAVRVSTREPREAGVRVPRELADLGIDAVVAAVPATTGDLVVKHGGLTVMAYPMVDGTDGWSGRMMPDHWASLGATARAVHDATLTPGAAALIRRERFDLAPYDVLVDLDAELQRAAPDAPAHLREFVQTWNEHCGTLLTMLELMHQLSVRLKAEPRRLVVCHGDLHPGNVLIDGDHVHVIDWDDLLLAPPERDFIFVPDLPGAGGSRLLSAYGRAPDQLDWVALTYARCERVVSDAIAWAEDALADVPVPAGEPTPAAWLSGALGPGSEGTAAVAAARCLPSDLLSPAVLALPAQRTDR